MGHKAICRGEHRAILGDLGEDRIQFHRFQAGQPAQKVQIIERVFKHLRAHFARRVGVA